MDLLKLEDYETETNQQTEASKPVVYLIDTGMATKPTCQHVEELHSETNQEFSPYSDSAKRVAEKLITMELAFAEVL